MPGPRWGTIQTRHHWHGVKTGKPDWTYESHTLAATLTHPDADETFHVIFNAYWEPLNFEIPSAPSGKKWCRLIDTNLASPDDIVDEKNAVIINDNSYYAEKRSVILLMAK
jgi:isoamylase